jgi:BioD-like phosphotransacetylase family protein
MIWNSFVLGDRLNVELAKNLGAKAVLWMILMEQVKRLAQEKS